MRQWELQSRFNQLLHVRTLNIGSLDLGNANNLDGLEASTMARSHFLVTRSDGSNTAGVTILLVHVVRAGTRVVSKPDAKILDHGGVLLKDLNALKIRFRNLIDRWDRTSLQDTISPLAFLTRFNFFKKYQNRDLATISLGAKRRMRYNLGVGFCSEGSIRPTT